MKLPDLVDFKIPAITLIIFGVTIGFIVIAGDLIGLDSEDASTQVTLILAATPLLIAGFVLFTSRGIFQSAALVGVGLAVAFLVHMMDEASILIPSVGMPANELIIVIITFFAAIAMLTAWFGDR